MLTNTPRIKTLLSPSLPNSETGVPRAKAATINRAYDEYCARVEAGEQIDPVEFSNAHGNNPASLLRRLELHRYFEEHPDIVDLLEPIPWPQVGDELGDAIVLAELGRGGVGRVYLAQDKTLPRKIVVKVSAFEDGEASRLSRLEHPNVVPVYFVDEDIDTQLALMFMPYQGRHTLHDVLDAVFGDSTSIPSRQLRWASVLRSLSRHESCETAKPDSPPSDSAGFDSTGLDSTGLDSAMEFDTSESTRQRISSVAYTDGVLNVVATIAEALQYCHDRGVFHFDLKPSNVLLTDDGTPLLIDFGVGVDEDQPDLRGGTRPYMSPEQIQSLLFLQTEHKPDGQSDVYSLALILCQLLTGQHPLHETAFVATEPQILLHQQEWDADAWGEAQQLPASVVNVIRQCLNVAPVERPTAGEFAQQLRQIVDRPARIRRRAFIGVLGGGIALGAWGISRRGAGTSDRTKEAAAAFEFGKMHLRSRQWDKAIADLGRAISIEGDNVRFLTARASAYCMRARDALDWKPKLGVDPQRGWFAGSRDIGLARNDYFAAHRVSDDPAIDACLAFCNYRLGHFRDAERYANRARKRGFENAVIANIEGISQYRQNRHSLSRLAAAAEAYPNYQPGLVNLAERKYCRALEGNLKVIPQGIDLLETALQLASDTLDVHFLLARHLDLGTEIGVFDDGVHYERIKNLLVDALDEGLLAAAAIRQYPWHLKVLDDPILSEHMVTAPLKSPRRRMEIEHPLSHGVSITYLDSETSPSTQT